MPVSPSWRPRAIVFDFDGTLVDTMQGFADIAGAVMAARYEVPFAWGREEYLRTSGLPFFQQLEVIFPGDARNAEAAAEFERRKLDGFFGESIEAPVRSAIEALRAEGYRVAVSSNNFQHLVDRFVERESVELDCVLGCRDGFFKGRHHFEHIQRELDLRADEVLFVGDSLMDAVRAKECGVRFVGKLGTFGRRAFEEAHPGTPTIDSIAELPELLERLAHQ